MENLRKPLSTCSLRFFQAARDLIYKQNGEDENLIICPFTLAVVSTLLYYACEGTEARRQLEALLKYESLFEGHSDREHVLLAYRYACRCLHKHCKDASDDEDYVCGNEIEKKLCIQLATKIFIQHDVDIHEAFLDKCNKHLYMEVERLELNDNAENDKEQIQKWFKSKINGRFSSELDFLKIDEKFKGPRAVIASASYLRAGWQTPFERSQTYTAPFRLDSGKTKDVKYMRAKRTFPLVVDEHIGVKMIEIPYVNNEASLVITMPMKRTMTMQEFFVKIPSDAYFTELHMRRRMKMVDLHLPKFFIESSYDLRTLLNYAGVKEIFRDESSLKELTPEQVFRISEGIDKCAIQVDEDGTFATDKSSRNSTPTRTPEEAEKVETKPDSFFGKFIGKFSKTKEEPTDPNVEEFKADASFLVAIRHNKSSLFIFSGVVMCP